MIIDPLNQTRAFLGVKSVWKTDDVKSAGLPIWTPVKSNVGFIASPTSTSTGTPSGTPSSTPTATPTPIRIRPDVTEMAVAPSDSNYMWVAENIAGEFGNLYRSTNALATGTATPTWTPMDNNGSSPLPNRGITKILIDQNSTDGDSTVYVAFAGFKNDNLWRTTNHGVSWEDISGGSPNDSCLPNLSLNGLPCAPIRAIARHPNNPKILWVGTEIGIYATANATSPASQIVWRPEANGPANVSIDELTFIKVPSPQTPTVLLAGTYGRGIWMLNLGSRVSSVPVMNDFDGDGRSDIAVVREDSAHKMWHLQGSSESYRSQEFGNRDDQAAPADYDGDGKTDIAVYRGTEQKFYCLRSSDNTLATTQLNHQASQAEAALAADFDGDDLADKAVFDPYTGNWKVEQSSNGHLDFHWGEVGDTAVALDFNTDGQADFGVYHEANGMITLSYTANGEEFQKQFGLEGDVPVPGEYDGDKAMDLAVWRPDDDGEGNGCWYISYGANNYEGYDAIPWGQSGDIPVPGDYDGDGKLDIAVFRPSDGLWHMLQSSNGYYSELFGADGDKPVGIKATYASRGAGNHTFTRAPAWAVPARRAPVRGVKQDTSADQAD